MLQAADAAALVLRALLAWGAHDPHPATAAQLQPWADAMGDVCLDESACLRLAARAFEESRFVSWVLDGSCNDATWRRAHQADRVCDSGQAFGPWQIWDPRLAGASPAIQASVAFEKMRRYPRQWATWKAADARAARWLAGVVRRP